MPRFTVERQTNNNNNNNNNNSSWWTGEKQATTRNLVVRIPPISEKVRAVIASKLTKKQPWLLQKANLDQAQHRAQVAREKLKHAQMNLEILQNRRDQALADVREVRGKHLQVLLKETEEHIRKEAQQEIDTKEQECRMICEDMEAKMIATLKDKEVENEEFSKRPLNNQERGKEEPPTKRLKFDDGKENSTAESEESLSAEEPIKKSAMIEQRVRDVEVAKEKVEKLEETKKEMVWLLKQVIKAEAKENLTKLKFAKEKVGVAVSVEPTNEETVHTINPVN